MTAVIPGIAELEEQESRLTLSRFTYDDAWRPGTLPVEPARARNAPVAVDIRRGGRRLFHAALPGSTPTCTRPTAAPSRSGWRERG